MEKIKKLDINNIIFKLLLLFPITTVIQGIIIFNPINKILTGLIMVMSFFLILKEPKKNEITLTITVIILSIIGILFCKNYDFNINNLFFFAFFSLLMIYFSKKSDLIKQYLILEKKYINFILILWNMIVFSSLFFKTSYTQISTWGEKYYFISYSDGASHRFASTCLLIIVLIWIQTKNLKKKIYLIEIIFPFICILLTGARTYLLLSVALIFCILYDLFENKKKFLLYIIPMFLGLFIIMCFTPMMEKLITSFKDNPWLDGRIANITSGRTMFWKEDLECFFKQKPINQILGCGVSFVFDVNKNYIQRNIYAHNDFINILITYGYCGLIIYFLIWINMLKKYINKNIPIILILGFYFINFITAFLNGLYVYPCAIVIIPLMLFCTEKLK